MTDNRPAGYKGVCIGGPYHRQMLNCTEPVHRLSEPIPDGLTFGDEKYKPRFVQREYHYIKGRWEYQE